MDSEVLDFKKPETLQGSVKKRSLKSYEWLPVTMKQFEDLSNQFLLHFNEGVCQKTMALDPDYMAQILTSSIHALKTEDGKVYLETLFGACVKRISMHVTYHITEEIQKKLKAQKGTETVDTSNLVGTTDGQVLPDEATGVDMVQSPPPVA